MIFLQICRESQVEYNEFQARKCQYNGINAHSVFENLALG